MTMNKNHNIVIGDVYRNTPLFAKLKESELKEISVFSNIKRYKKEEIIFLEGDHADLLYIVAEGRVKMFKTSSCGKIFICMIAVPYDPLISVPTVNITERFLSAIAMDDVTLITFRRVQFRVFISRHPEIALNLNEYISGLFLSAFNRIIDLIGEYVEQRLINVLYILNLKFGATLNFTSEELGQMSGMTAETVRRTLGNLRKMGVIETGRGRISILDKANLEKLCWQQYTI